MTNLWGHVVERSYGITGARQLLLSRIRSLCDAKVDQDCCAILPKHEVRWLQIAKHDAVFVHERECVTNLQK